jgi:excisionase family DNA binding protein
MPNDLTGRPPPLQQSHFESLESTYPLTVAEVASFLGVGDDVVRDLIRMKKLRSAKVGGQYRILRSDLSEYLMSTFNRS